MTHDEFIDKYESHMKESSATTMLTEEKISSRPNTGGNIVFMEKQCKDNDDIIVTENNVDKITTTHIKPYERESLTNIVLKFTTLSETATEAPSFFIGMNKARIGRDIINEITVPSDTRLAPIGHAIIEYSKNNFYLLDCGYEYAASVRIGVGGHKKKWIMEKEAQFSAGNSIFRSNGINDDGDLIIDIIEGPLKNDKHIMKKDAIITIGRASDNKVCVPDRELSRHHSQIEYDNILKHYVVSDMGSTNGTYIQLVGPNSGKHKLNLNDHILVGRTGFSINRFDFGVSEEIGHRQTMEDACTIVQHLNMLPLNIKDLSPQSFFGIFDGHGGVEASYYLSQHLHINVADCLLAVADQLLAVYEKASTSMSTIWAGGNQGNNQDTKNNTNMKQGIENKDSFDLNILKSSNGINHNSSVKDRESENNGDIMQSTTFSSTFSSSSSSATATAAAAAAAAAITTTTTNSNYNTTELIDQIVIKTLKAAFLKTDEEFLRTSNYPQHGSTATTALLLGKRLYCANVGDSRTLLSRYVNTI